ncbi:MAG: hypothetical protein WBN60_09615, partial [Polyangiales bacterium]
AEMSLGEVRRTRTHMHPAQLDRGAIRGKTVVHADDAEPLVEYRKTSFQNSWQPRLVIQLEVVSRLCEINYR